MASYQTRLYNYSPCDSYFIEQQEDGVFAAAAAGRERQRQVAKQGQKVLAVELSRITADEYERDHLHHMEHMEVRSTNKPALRFRIMS